MHIGVGSIPVAAGALHRVDRAHVVEEPFGSFEGATVKGVDLGEPVERSDELVVPCEVVDCGDLRHVVKVLVVGVIELHAIGAPVKVRGTLGVALVGAGGGHSTKFAHLAQTALTSDAYT